MFTHTYKNTHTYMHSWTVRPRFCQYSVYPARVLGVVYIDRSIFVACPSPNKRSLLCVSNRIA